MQGKVLIVGQQTLLGNDNDSFYDIVILSYYIISIPNVRIIVGGHVSSLQTSHGFDFSIVLLILVFFYGENRCRSMFNYIQLRSVCGCNYVLLIHNLQNERFSLKRWESCLIFWCREEFILQFYVYNDEILICFMFIELVITFKIFSL